MVFNLREIGSDVMGASESWIVNRFNSAEFHVAQSASQSMDFAEDRSPRLEPEDMEEVGLKELEW